MGFNFVLLNLKLILKNIKIEPNKRDIEMLLYGAIGASLIHYYYMPGNQINSIYVDQNAKMIRLEQIINSNGEIKTTVIPRNKITPVTCDQVQATVPIFKKEQKIGSIALTSKTSIYDPLLFELIFGPFVFNSHQFFQVGK